MVTRDLGFTVDSEEEEAAQNTFDMAVVFMVDDLLRRLRT